MISLHVYTNSEFVYALYHVCLTNLSSNHCNEIKY